MSNEYETPAGEAGEWNHGLLSCFGNLGVCCVTYFCPCYTFGKIAESVDDPCCLCGIVCLVPVLNIVCGTFLRRKVREKHGIKGGCCGDLFTFICCPCCALIQEARQMNALFGDGDVKEEVVMERE